jgi:sporulation protein YlmC with PRC-barrel domain
MELVLGSHVREAGRRVGQLAGFELEPVDLRIRRIIFSPDGELGPQAMTRSLAAITSVHDDGEVELHSDVNITPMPAVPDIILLSRATRIRRGGRQLGRLSGVAVDPAERKVVSVFGRPHWWSRRFTLAALDLDCSTPGEIRGGGTRAA